ncbi:MAG: ATP cone domain-containing protein [Bacteroidota bacterium]
MAPELIYITKSSGERVPYEAEKLRHSLAKAGADYGLVETILTEVEKSLYNGISSKKIYRQAFNLLKKQSRPNAAKYKLKRALMELGPSGFPFEKYIGEILAFHGYQIEVGIMMEGQCISHEVDVLAKKEKRQLAVECKFGNKRDKKVDVKVALYIHSRFRDLEQKWQKQPDWGDKQAEGWIVTNASFTRDAATYGSCAGLTLISWDYPAQGNLKDLIERSGLYPLTSLSGLTKAEKQHLLEAEIVLAKGLLERPAAFEELRMSTHRRKKLLDEVEGLCGHC